MRAGGRGTIAKAVNGSKGCRGVMRAASAGLFPRRFNAAEAFQLVRLLLDGAAFDEAIERGCELLGAHAGHEETLAVVRKALDPAVSIKKLGEGWVGEEAIAIAIYAVLNAETFIDAIRIAANHDGDSDSTASIAGQLWGARHGIEGMPHGWIADLDVLEPLLHLSRTL